MLAKIRIAFCLISLGFDVFYTDGDIVFNTNIVEAIDKVQKNAFVYDLII